MQRATHNPGESTSSHAPIPNPPPPSAIDQTAPGLNEPDYFFDFSWDLLCIAGFDGYFKRVNPAWERVLGYSEAELLAQPFIEFVHPDDRAKTDLKAIQIANGGKAVDFENRYRCKDGTYRWFCWSATGQPALQRIFAVARDVTAQRVAQQEIQQLNRDLQAQAQHLAAVNQELEAFAYSVSHDLRAPLRSIDGFSKALLDDAGERLDETGKKHLERVRLAAKRMGQLIEDLLRLSRVTRADMQAERVDLSALAREVAATLQLKDPPRQIEWVIEPDQVGQGDARMIRIVLENLLENAWKFSGTRPIARIEFNSQSNNGATEFFVRDNGVGFDARYVGKLFGAFQRLHNMTEYPGNGIGLATVQRIVRRHGGAVRAEGAVDQGATIYFTLAPRREDA